MQQYNQEAEIQDTLVIQMPYGQSQKYLRNFLRFQGLNQENAPNWQNHFLQTIISTTPKNDPASVLKAIDNYCTKHPMMNIGDQKSQIVKDAIKQFKPKSILQLGGFCGYSSIMMAHASQAMVHSIQPNKAVASIAYNIHQHCGLTNRIQIHLGTIQSEVQFIVKHGKFDLIFIDHIKNLYLPDLNWLEAHGAIKKGTVVIGDNIIFPGCPEYHQHFKTNNQYNSILYHSYLEYSDQADAVLVSERISE